MNRTIIITYKDPKTQEVLIDHGIKEDTLQIVVLPNVPLWNVKTYFDKELMEYVLA